MADFFKKVDNIVKLGKWAFLKIPNGRRCKRCPLLEGEARAWACGLRPTIALIFDEDGAFKDPACPSLNNGGA